MYFPSPRTQSPPVPRKTVRMPAPHQGHVKAALIERAAAYGQSNGFVVPIETPEAWLVQQLCLMRELVSRLSRSTVAQFSITCKPAGAQIQSTDLGAEVLQLLSTLVDKPSRQYPCHLFEPRVELFIECITKRNLLSSWHSLRPMTEVQLLPIVDALNGFVQDIRRRAKTLSFKAKVATFQQRVNQRHQDMQSYFSQLSTLYPHAHVIRMDFSYQLVQMFGFSSDTDRHRTAGVHGEALLQHLTRTLGSAVAGYAWKLDFAASRGFQYHLVAILDGPQDHELPSIEESLAQQWEQEITQGIGLCFNCHGAWANNFQYRGIGYLRYQARSIEEQLKQVSVFMTLTDEIVELAPLGREKCSGMGTIDTPMPKRQVRATVKQRKMPSEAPTEPWPFSAWTPGGLV